MPLNKEITKEPFWSLGAEEVLNSLNSGLDGLSEQEAASRRQIFGSNVIKERRRLSKAKIFLRQLKSPLVLILIAAGAVVIFLGEWVETGVIFAAVIANTLLGFWQENKAETVLELLKGYIRTRARVRRAGLEREIDAEELVPGDVVRVTQGDRVPADARVLFVNDFEVDEAVLTGESLPISKNTHLMPAATALADRRNMVFLGSLVMQGFADVAVTSTGNDTEFGKIAALVSEKEREATPLQQSVSRFAAYSGTLLVVFTALLFGLGVYSGKDVYDMFLIAVAAAVSAVPEGLPAALTVIMAIGVQRLAARKGIVRRLLAVETLGS